MKKNFTLNQHIRFGRKLFAISQQGAARIATVLGQSCRRGDRIQNLAYYFDRDLVKLRHAMELLLCEEVHEKEGLLRVYSPLQDPDPLLIPHLFGVSLQLGECFNQNQINKEKRIIPVGAKPGLSETELVAIGRSLSSIEKELVRLKNAIRKKYPKDCTAHPVLVQVLSSHSRLKAEVKKLKPATI